MRFINRFSCVKTLVLMGIIGMMGMIRMAGHLPAERGQAALKPLMVKPGKVILAEDFNKSGPVSRKTTFRGKQGTPWKIKDGVLWGEANSPEVQAKRPKYKGKEPRGFFHTTPRHYMATFDFTYRDGKQTKIAPFIEFGHHVCRVSLKKEGASLVVRGLAPVHDDSFQFEIGKTYQVMVEMMEDEFLIQFKHGPIYYAKDPSIAEAESHAIGLCGTSGGTVAMDQIRIWESSGYLPDWKATRERLALVSPSEPAQKKSK